MERTDNRSKGEAQPAHSLPLEESLENTCLNFLPFIHPSDCRCFLELNPKGIQQPLQISVSGGTEQRGEGWRPDLQDKQKTPSRWPYLGANNRA